jgi:hypothetical protein
MKRRTALLSALLFLPLGCCATSYMLLDPPWKDRRVERLRADANSHVPVGSTRQQVEEWFASHGLRCGPVFKIGEGERAVGYCAQVEDDAGLETANIWIQFNFDQHDRVSSIFIERTIVSS